MNVYLNRSAKSLITAVFAVIVFASATVWVASREVSADTMQDKLTTTTVEESDALDTVPDTSTSQLIASADIDETSLATEDTASQSSITTEDADATLADTTTSIDSVSDDQLTATTPRPRAPLHWAILIADAIVVLGLLATLVFRLLSNVLNPTAAQPAVTTGLTPAGRPLTIDDLKLDLP